MVLDLLALSYTVLYASSQISKIASLWMEKKYFVDFDGKKKVDTPELAVGLLPFPLDLVYFLAGDAPLRGDLREQPFSSDTLLQGLEPKLSEVSSHKELTKYQIDRMRRLGPEVEEHQRDFKTYPSHPY